MLQHLKATGTLKSSMARTCASVATRSLLLNSYSPHLSKSKNLGVLNSCTFPAISSTAAATNLSFLSGMSILMLLSMLRQTRQVSMEYLKRKVANLTSLVTRCKLWALQHQACSCVVSDIVFSSMQSQSEGVVHCGGAFLGSFLMIFRWGSLSLEARGATVWEGIDSNQDCQNYIYKQQFKFKLVINCCWSQNHPLKCNFVRLRRKKLNYAEQQLLDRMDYVAVDKGMMEGQEKY